VKYFFVDTIVVVEIPNMIDLEYHKASKTVHHTHTDHLFVGVERDEAGVCIPVDGGKNLVSESVVGNFDVGLLVGGMTFLEELHGLLDSLYCLSVLATSGRGDIRSKLLIAI